MKQRLSKTALVLVVVLLASTGAWAQVSTGSADFTRYVALGDSLTAGFTSGGLGGDVQANSYPAIIAEQAGVSDFQQPLISAPGIPNELQLVSLQGPVILPASGAPGAPLNLTLPRPYNNMAVPGFRARDILQTVTGNPLIDVILRGLGTQLQQALVQQPTFVTLWIGNNDVLGAATSGRVIDGVTLTTLASFEMDYRAIVGALTQAGAKLAMATVPNVTALPFVNTLPTVLVDPATRQPVLVNGQPIPLIGPDGLLGPGDKVLLTAGPLLAQGIGIPQAVGGTGQPLPDEVVLSAAEVAKIQNRIAGINDIIRTVAGETGAALFDANSFFDQVVQQGIPVGGVDYTTSFLTGGLFSFDGVHPTAFGYAVVAQQFIDAINAQYGADIPQVDLFPYVFGLKGQFGSGLNVQPEKVIFSTAAADSLKRSLRVFNGEGLQKRVMPGEAGRESLTPKRPLRDPVRQ